jgi:hypothetical protein
MRALHNNTMNWIVLLHMHALNNTGEINFHARIFPFSDLSFHEIVFFF